MGGRPSRDPRDDHEVESAPSGRLKGGMAEQVGQHLPVFRTRPEQLIELVEAEPSEAVVLVRADVAGLSAPAPHPPGAQVELGVGCTEHEVQPDGGFISQSRPSTPNSSYSSRRRASGRLAGLDVASRQVHLAGWARRSALRRARSARLSRMRMPTATVCAGEAEQRTWATLPRTTTRHSTRDDRDVTRRAPLSMLKRRRHAAPSRGCSAEPRVETGVVDRGVGEPAEDLRAGHGLSEVSGPQPVRQSYDLERDVGQDPAVRCPPALMSRGTPATRSRCARRPDRSCPGVRRGRPPAPVPPPTSRSPRPRCRADRR